MRTQSGAGRAKGEPRRPFRRQKGAKNMPWATQDAFFALWAPNVHLRKTSVFTTYKTNNQHVDFLVATSWTLPPSKNLRHDTACRNVLQSITMGAHTGRQKGAGGGQGAKNGVKEKQNGRPQKMENVISHQSMPQGISGRSLGSFGVLPMRSQRQQKQKKKQA